MNSHTTRTKKLNVSLTKRLIELHAKGYHFDYMVACQGKLLCIQNNLAVPVDSVSISVVDQVYDQLSQSFKYIHTIDAGNGEPGLMVAEAIVTNPY